MSNSDSAFCPRLQRHWALAEAKCSPGTVKLRLEQYASDPFPNPMGRPGHLVLAEPKVFRVLETVEVTFNSVLWFEVVDEFSYSVSSLPRDGEGLYSGTTFRCYTDSALLADQRKSRTESEAGNLKHYQLITQDAIINILATKAPEAVLRSPAPNETKYAGNA